MHLAQTGSGFQLHTNKFKAGAHPSVCALTFLILQDVGCEAALVSHIGGVLAVLLLDDVLQVVVDLGSDAHGLLEAAGAHGQDHELLHGQLVAGVGASVDDVEGLQVK